MKFAESVKVCLGAGVVLLALWGVALAEDRPSVSIESPLTSALVSGQVEIQVAYRSNSEEPITKVVVYIDQKLAFGGDIEPVLSGNRRFVWDTAAYPDGPHSIGARAMDKSGNTGSVAVNVKVANAYVAGGQKEPFLIAIVSPHPGDEVSGTVDVVVKAQNDSDVQWISYFVDGKFWAARNFPPFTQRWDSTAYPEGQHHLSATAYGSEDRKAEASVDVIINNTGKPVSTAGAPKEVSEETPAEQIIPMTALAKVDFASPEFKESFPLETALSPEETALTPEETASQPSEATAMVPLLPEGNAATEGVLATILEPLAQPGAVPMVTQEPMTLALLPPIPREASLSGWSSPLMTNLKPEGVPYPLQEGSEGLWAKSTAPAFPGSVTLVPPLATGLSPAPGAPLERHASQEPAFLLVMLPGTAAVGETTSGTPTLAVVALPEAVKKVEVPKVESALLPVEGGAIPEKAVKELPLEVVMLPPHRTEGELAPVLQATPEATPQVQRIPGMPIIWYDGEPVAFPDTPAHIYKGMALAPLRFIIQHKGGTIHWYPDGQQVKAITADGSKVIQLWIGHREIRVNGKEEIMPIRAYLVRGRTIVSLRFFAHILDADLSYNPSTGDVSLATKTEASPTPLASAK